MNNLFGSQQPGQFQPPASSVSGVFQPLQPPASSVSGVFQPLQPPVSGVFQPLQPPASGVFQPLQPPVSGVSGVFQPLQPLASSVSGVFQPLQPLASSVSGMFQSQTGENPSFGQTSGFGQQTAFSQPGGFGQQMGFGQSSGFGQTPAFGQSSGLGQNPVFGQSTGLGQSRGMTLAAGQGQGQPPSYTQSTRLRETMAFETPSRLGQSTAGFAPPPSYTQSTGLGQSTVFGQSTGFGQNQGKQSTLGQSSGFTQPFAQSTRFPQSAGFGQSSSFPQVSSAPVPGSESGQAIRFSQPVVSSFRQPPAFGLTSSTSSNAASTLGSQSVTFTLPSSSTTGIFSTPSSSIGKTKEAPCSFGNFKFKPSDTAVFKPIFSVSPEPANPQPAASVVSSSSGFSLLSASTDAVPGFTFSKPSAPPSNNSVSANVSQDSSLEFNFLLPTAHATGQTFVSTTSASTFSFSEKVVDVPPATQPPFGSTGSGFEQPSNTSAFGKLGKSEAAAGGQEEVGSEGQGEVAFGGLGKGTKRKEESVERPPPQEESSKGSRDEPRCPPKRPLLKSRGPARGLFHSALSHVLKESGQSVNRESKRQQQWEEMKTHLEAPAPHPAPQPSTTPPRTRVSSREERAMEEPEEDTRSPSRRSRRTESTDSLGGALPNDLTAIQCKNVPPHLNKKEIMEKHFSRFGKVQRVYCRLNRNLTIVHFHDHASAYRAKKKGKSLHREEIAIFWQKKKPSPGDKAESSLKNEEEAETKDKQGSFQPSDTRKAVCRSSAVGNSSLSKGSPTKKSSSTKCLQFEAESQHDSGSEGQSSEPLVGALPSSLNLLIGRVAETSEEKYRLLEQKDKIMRQGRAKRTELDLSKVFVGTCPDMCPEKERFMRETRNQLSIFEVIPGTDRVDHTSAIKEYSRSSADQEEPLPHELRPSSVLNMTMDYLVTQIMDKGEGNYRDWYDFVWNRTRGIRKDITQQHLCDPLTASLIEKCTRFHIHCAHHLCEEPMMAFDAKINNENMTKCLQSLKEMYQDMATKKMSCPGEEEFRQYSVLLKLNDGDILREVQQFRPEIRNSPEVKFAVQAFAALNSNNFVRFFKLVRGASYLSSCILHRYFNQVRRDALKALNIAYTVGSQRSTTFPIDGLARMLMFQDDDEAADYAMQYGLIVNDGMVELSRSGYQEPEVPIPPRKSADIARKRAVLIGEVVNGGPLHSPPQHNPVISFDSKNRYRGEGLMAEQASTGQRGPQGSAAPVVIFKQELKPLMQDMPTVPVELQIQPLLAPAAQLIVQPEPQPPLPPPKPQPVYTDQDICEVIQALLEDVLKVECTEVARAGADYTSTALCVSETEVEVLVDKVVEQLLKQTSITEISAEKQKVDEEKRSIQEARLKQERELFIAQFSSSLCSELTEEVLGDFINCTAASEIQHALQEKAACIAHCTEEVCCYLMEQTLDTDIYQLAKDTLQVEVQRIHKYLKRWRDVVAVRRQLKRQMRGFPAAPCCVDPKFKLKALAPSALSPPALDFLAKGLVNMGNAGNIAVSCTRVMQMRDEAIHRMKVQYYQQLLLSQTVWTPLALPELISESVSSARETIFWKAVLLLPSEEECEASLTNRILSDWLKAKFGGGEQSEDMVQHPGNKIQTLTICNSFRNRRESHAAVHVCIKMSQGSLSDCELSEVEAQKELLGTSALVMLLPSLRRAGGQEEEEEEVEEEEDVYWLSALLQLKQILQAKPLQPALPLVVLVPRQGEQAVREKLLVQGLMLQSLVAAHLISEYIFIHIPEFTNDLQGSKQICQAVQWLASRCPPPPDLCAQTLVQFVEDGLCREFSERFYHHKKARQVLGLPCQDPATVIQLYNSVLAFLAELVSSEQLSQLSWPVCEFRTLLPHLDWNSAEHLAWLWRAILSLHIPQLELPPAQAPWPAVCAVIFQYASQIPSSKQTQPILISKVEHLLNRVYTEWSERSSTGSPVNQAEWSESRSTGPPMNQVPWDDIVALCIDHRLRDWKPPASAVAEEAITEDGHIVVYFVKEDVKKYKPPPSWEQALKQTQEELQQDPVGLSPLSTKPGLNSRQRVLRSISEEHVESRRTSVLDITHTASAEELLPDRLLSSIEAEKAASNMFEKQLQQWLELDPLDSFSMPLYIPQALVSAPETMLPTTPSAAAVTQGMADCDCVSSAPISLGERLKELDRLIGANKEEELACELQLSTLLHMVDN
ncbi:germinal-center associated nuclear protein [Acipenser oxyrinchus oxyrinchus]|uniref:Germinal-center associated nuclear protein n=1 Tax=Acipenser oxyrinchus oxyrinchus TaxID=40147 RepID=A0AAD8G2J4_ACIOX|nr:germinal-center associated nuclear protein [Acipenser oxyrinchus oxyrinchus]